MSKNCMILSVNDPTTALACANAVQPADKLDQLLSTSE